VELTEPQRDELRSAVTTGELPTLTDVVRDWRRQLQAGLGVLLVRGVPVEDLTDDQARTLFTLLGTHLGEPVSQNKDGDLITDIRDVGNDPNDPDVRLYTTAAEQDFHTDGADLIGLLCLKTAREGGINRLVSSVTVYDEIARQRPDLAQLLLQDWHFFLHTQKDLILESVARDLAEIRAL